MRHLAKLLVLAALTLLFEVEQVQAEYPERPVTFVVPWPPGDLEDILTRLIAADFSKAYGVDASVVNIPGGAEGPFPGAVEVATAPADGYQIGSFISAVPVIGPRVGIEALSPDPFVPLGSFLTYPFVIASGKRAGFSTMAELADYAQDNDLMLGHFGNGLLPTDVTLAAAKELGFEFAADAAFDALDCNALGSGAADVISTTLQLIMPCLDEVNVLASIGAFRIDLIPDTPTVGELIPSLNVELWNGLFVHADTPKTVQEKIIAVAQASVLSERAQLLARDTGAQIYWQGPSDAEAQIKQDISTMRYIDEIISR